MSIDSREWLETDGRGGYAMGCVDGVRTRRYHAIVCHAMRAPEGRVVLVADLEAWIETAAGRFALSTHRYADGVLHPDGATHRAAFTHEPWPRWEWQLPGGVRVACELAIARGPRGPITLVRWTRLAGRGDARLWVRPLLAARDYHAVQREHAGVALEARIDPERVSWQLDPGLPAVVAVANARYEHAPDWYRGFVLEAERERGLEFTEDLAAPGILHFDLVAAPAVLALAVGDAPFDGAAGARAFVEGGFAAERDRRAAFATPIDRAADAYLVERGSGRTVIAGYPWFCDWGRDTFISLRGLCLDTHRRDDAREILRQWAGAVSEGMLPNRYEEGSGAAEYNSVDAALWFVIAADAFLTVDGKRAGHREIEEAIVAIVNGYARGTRHGIRVDDDGLLACGEPGFQLTWMDAKVGDHVITPRIGKPVEIQALWLNALAIARGFDMAWRELEERGRKAFVARFWDGARGQLHDVVDCDHVAGTVDSACRPNQIFAVGGLPHALIAGTRARAIVDTVERALWTPAGPRSLAPSDPRYRGRYFGDQTERDGSYHNGPVWPWLAGAFVEAWVRVRGGSDDVKREARARFYAPLAARLDRAGLGHLAEIYEGDRPHRAVGCPFQAWSVAELIRIDRSVLGNALPEPVVEHEHEHDH